MHIKIGTKRSNFYTGFWEGFTGHVANWLLEKPDRKRDIPFHQSMPVYIKQIVAGIVYDQMEEKLSYRLMAALFNYFCLENIECSKYELIFVTTEEVLWKPYLSWLKKNCLTISLISSVCQFLISLILIGYLLISGYTTI